MIGVNHNFTANNFQIWSTLAYKENSPRIRQNQTWRIILNNDYNVVVHVTRVKKKERKKERKTTQQEHPLHAASVETVLHNSL